MELTELYECLADIFNDFTELIVAVSKFSVGEDLFNQTAIAALVKSYEFNCIINKHACDNIFPMISSLRGICEDYIVLRYIFSELPNNKDQIIHLMVSEDTYASSIVQWKFFEKYHPNQVLYYKVDFPQKRDECKDKLRNLTKSHRRQSLPSVKDMANKTGLNELYEYIYHATSAYVHYNPHILLRMGWGNLPEITYSTRNFDTYYKHFACFYGAYLFKELCVWMISIGLLDNAIEAGIQKIVKLLGEEPYWPEIITFEEMNIGGITKYALYDSPNLFNRGISND